MQHFTGSAPDTNIFYKINEIFDLSCFFRIHFFPSKWQTVFAELKIFFFNIKEN